MCVCYVMVVECIVFFLLKNKNRKIKGPRIVNTHPFTNFFIFYFCFLDSEAENEVNRRRSKIRSTNTEPTEPPKLEIVEQLSGDSDQETTKKAKERRKSRR